MDADGSCSSIIALSIKLNISIIKDVFIDIGRFHLMMPNSCRAWWRVSIMILFSYVEMSGIMAKIN